MCQWGNNSIPFIFYMMYRWFLVLRYSCNPWSGLVDRRMVVWSDLRLSCWKVWRNGLDTLKRNDSTWLPPCLIQGKIYGTEINKKTLCFCGPIIYMSKIPNVISITFVYKYIMNYDYCKNFHRAVILYNFNPLCLFVLLLKKFYRIFFKFAIYLKD